MNLQLLQKPDFVVDNGRVEFDCFPTVFESEGDGGQIRIELLFFDAVHERLHELLVPLHFLVGDFALAVEIVDTGGDLCERAEAADGRGNS